MEKMKMMLVDDEEQFLSTTQKLLSRKGYQVLTATNGSQALEKLKTHDIHVVVLDVKMPGMDGIETLKAIKWTYPLIEVIMLTGHATMASAIDGLKSGATDYLVKPTDVQRLIEKAEEAFGKRRALEEKVRAVLSDKLAALGKMAAGIGHEINNPLAVIYQITGWMKDLLIDEGNQEGKNREEYLTCLTKIDENVRRVREVVHNMLAYAGKLEISSDEVDVNSIINRAVSLLDKYARINNINISIDPAPNLPVIRGNRSELEQVFLNFISNAVDAIGKDGSIQVKSQRIGSQIAVSIADNGPGIPEDQQGKIFDPFFTTKVTGKGTGLGLWVNYSYIEKMGGSISLKSEVGVGTTFTVRIPVTGPHDK